MTCRITFGVKWAGARSAGNPHATCDRAGPGNGAMDGLRHQHNGESRWSTATPQSCRHRASPRPYRAAKALFATPRTTIPRWRESSSGSLKTEAERAAPISTTP